MGKKKEQNKDKVSILRMFANVNYVLRFAVREDKLLVIGYIAGVCIHKVLQAFINTIIVKTIIEMLIGNASLPDILRFLIMATAIMIFETLFAIFLTQTIEIRSIKAIGAIQRRFLEKSAKMDLICYDDADYFNDFVIAAGQADDMVSQAVSCVSRILGDGLAILTIGAIIATINPWIAIFPVVGFLVNILSRFEITRVEYQYDMERKRINRRADYAKRVFYQPEYAKEIKLTDIEAPLREQFRQAIADEKKIAKQYGRKIALLSLVNWCFSFTILQYFSVPVYLGYLALVRKSISLGDVVILRNATETIQWRLDQTNYAFIDFQRVGQYAEKFRRFIEYQEKIESSAGICGIPDGDRALEIRNMSFSYKNDGQYALKNINMTIRPGEKIAIVGENGAGKTTFIKLIMRLYDVSDGEILYGNQDIRNYPVSEYRDQIGAVFQDFQIYAADLAENVKMDNRDFENEGEKEILKNALIMADFGGKYEKLENGLETELTREFSDSGTMLSGGESQKVAIARLFAKPGKLKLAILDEPSSALDPLAEYALNTAMADKAKDSAIIFISHRLSTTRDANRIYMFEGGEISEEGTHAELMELGGKYAEMFEKQSKYYYVG